MPRRERWTKLVVPNVRLARKTLAKPQPTRGDLGVAAASLDLALLNIGILHKEYAAQANELLVARVLAVHRHVKADRVLVEEHLKAPFSLTAIRRMYPTVDARTVVLGEQLLPPMTALAWIGKVIAPLLQAQSFASGDPPVDLNRSVQLLEDMLRELSALCDRHRAEPGKALEGEQLALVYNHNLGIWLLLSEHVNGVLYSPASVSAHLPSDESMDRTAAMLT